MLDYTLIIILAILAIFLLLREFWCWYWKINERNKILKSIDARLAKILGDEVPKSESMKINYGDIETDSSNPWSGKKKTK